MNSSHLIAAGLGSLLAYAFARWDAAGRPNGLRGFLAALLPFTDATPKPPGPSPQPPINPDVPVLRDSLALTRDALRDIELLESTGGRPVERDAEIAAAAVRRMAIAILTQGLRDDDR